MARILLLILLLCTALAQADGKYFGSKPVKTPYQRAVIVHEKGQQTMLIESFALTGDRELSWVVPVPSDKADIGASRFSAQSADRLYRLPLPPRTPWSESWAWIPVALAAIIAISIPSFPPMVRLGMFMALFAVVLAYPLFADPLSAKKGIEFLKYSKSGPWEIVLVRSDSPAELREWLKTRNTPLPPEAEPVIAEYIRQGWCFAAAHATLSETSMGAPNGLIFRFPAEKPIYPMKLTGVGGDPLALDLVVLSDQGEAVIKGMEVWAVKKARWWPYLREALAYDLAGEPPDDREVTPLWQTRLHGRLDAAAQKDDLTIDFQPARERELTVVPTETFVPMVFQKAIACTIFLLGLIGLLFGKQANPERTRTDEIMGASVTVLMIFAFVIATENLPQFWNPLKVVTLSTVAFATLMSVQALAKGGKPHCLALLRRLAVGTLALALLTGWFYMEESRGRVVLNQDGSTLPAPPFSFTPIPAP